MTSSLSDPRQSVAEQKVFFPASFGQQRLWFIDQLTPGKATYVIPSVLRILGPLHVQVLEKTMAEIVRRHETLRTRFVPLGGEPQQVIEDHVQVQLPVLDLAHLAGSQEREKEARRLAQEESQQPFDLQQTPLFRAKLLRLNEQDHVLLFTMHHIISDIWSTAVLIEEVSILYAAFSAGQDSPLPELPIQYADYSVWQRECLEGGVLEEQLTYWKQQLAGVSMLQLPTDRPRPVSQSQNGTHCQYQIQANLTQGLKKLAEEQNSTLFMVLLAAFHTLLYRYSGQQDITVGTPIAGRNSSETEKLIGLFLNTLVLRVDLSGEPGFTELLQRVREVTLEAYAHQDIPFEKLVEVLSPERNLGSTPLFQVMLTLQNAPQSDLRLGAATLQPFDAEDNGTAKFDLLLQLTEDRNGMLVGSLQYSTDLFEAASMQRLLRHYQMLLSGIVAHPAQSIVELPLLGTEERKQILEEWNRTTVAYPQGKFVPDLIEEQAHRTPQAIAVDYEGQTLNYQELNARANQLARRLQQLGVGWESRVGVMMERSLEMVVSLVAVLKAGAAYVPLDPDYPAERLGYMLSSTEVGVLLRQQRLGERGHGYAGVVVVVDEEQERERIASQSRENPGLRVESQHLAYIIYTSGSTGKPKGVMNSHGGLLNRLQWMQAEYQLDKQDVVLQKTPFSFDVSVWEFFWPLMVGAKLVVARPGGHQDPGYLARLMEERGVTTVHFVPSMLGVFLEEERGQQCRSLKRVVCSGEALSAELARRCLGSMPWAELHNLYGPTEAAIDVTYWKCEAGDERGSVLIGRAIANMRVYVVDGRMETVPVGVAGELCLGGVGLARGYWGRGDLTGERFVPDGLSGKAGERLYRTGDLVRWQGEGTLEYLGRIDHQVKIRGFRIELGEIESALESHPGVKQAVVLAREDHPGEKRLVAYVIHDSTVASSDATALEEHLKARLPEYMVPVAFISLEKWPLTPNGKIDRKSLPQPDTSVPKQEYVAPRNPMEEDLCGIWQEVLRQERVGIYDNFFKIGGHSLLAAQVATRIRKNFKVDIPLRAIFEAPTVGQLAQRIAAIDPYKEPPKLPILASIQPRPLRTPAAFGQQRLWFIDQLAPGKATYVIPSALRILGPLHVQVLEKTMAEIVRRHETLRTRFVPLGGEPQQVIEDHVQVQLPVLDLTHPGNQEREREARRLAQEESQQPFDLQRAPLFRAKLLRLSEQDHVLLFTMHHIISDIWSTAVLIEEVSILYAAFSAGQDSPLPELPIQYADYSVWQRECLEGGALEEQLTYWKQQLAGVSMLQLPTDRPRPVSQSQNGTHCQYQLQADLTQGLKKLAEEQNSTLFMVLLAAFHTLLYRYSGQQDITVGTPIAGRNSSETEKLIGLFLNTLVLRVDLSGEPGFTELLQRVREVTLEAYAHQDIPFEKLVEVLSPERNLGSTPLFQVMLTLQNAPQSDLRLGAATLQPFDAEDNGTAKFDLLLQLTEDRNGMLVGSLQYSTDLFEAASMQRLLRHYRMLLSGIVAHPAQSIVELPLLGTEERQQILEAWNRTTVAYPQGRFVPDLIEEQAHRTPQAIAVDYEGQTLNYQELNARANQLAWRLQQLGVGWESRVGVMMERSLEMVVSLVAVLKAGAAYVPLDPDYPAERLGYMLSSAEVGVLLRQQRLGERGGEYAGVVVEVDEEQERQRIESQSRENPGLRVESQHLAYIIYTSGSTGQPKGVMNSHGGLLNRLQWMQAEYQLGEQDVVLQKTPFSFDVSVWEFFWPLMMGAKLVVARPGGHQDPGYLAGLMEERGVTTVHFVPSMLGVFLEEERGQQCRSLKRVVCSGEALSAELARRCLGSMPWAELHNLYGPTEAAIDVTYWKCEAGDERGSVPIGRAIANMRVYVVDGRMETVPVGVAGELCLGGVGLARGYWGRGDLTGERFVPDGLSGKAGERLYRTGDLVRWQGDGTLEYLGRIDHQVKIRGFRIELGEIESALESHPGVKQAVVLAREDHPGEKRLVAYVVAGFDTQGSGTSELQINEIREYLKGKLPEYMVPNIYIWLEKLPLSPNGKIDRKALPAPDKEAYVRREYEAPVGEVETALAAIWADLLKVSQVGRHHNFFELGGHSLLAVSLIERMRTIGLHIDVRALFTTPTVAGLAAAAASDVDFVHVPENGVPAGCESIKPEMLSLIELSQGEIETIVSGVTGGASNVQEIYPLAPLQEGILFLHLMGEGSDPYVSGVLLSFDTRLGLDRYVDAMKTVIERHDILRTAVVWEGLREPVQVVWRKVSLLVEEVKLDPKAGDIGDQLYQRFDPRHYRIDVRRAPLIRLYIAYDEPNERWVAMMLRHHLTGDNTTVEVMLAEMEAHLLGRSELLPAPQQFRSLVARARLGANQEDHEAYFQKLLGDVDEPTAPFGLLDVQGDGSEIQEATISLDAALVRRMRERARKLGVSVAAICHVAWARVLASVSNREDVVFGTVLFGRMQGVAGSDRMMGLFINTLPVRIPINGQGAEASVLRTHQQLGELIRHEHVSLVVAQRCSSVQAPAPLFTSLLNYRHSLGGTIAPSAETEQAWQGVKWLRAEGRTNYPFGLSIEDGGMAFTLLVQTVGGIDPKRVCEYTRKALESLVESLEKEPEKAVRTLDVLSARERHQVLYDWNATTVAYPSHNCIHELFEEQVQKQPDAIAVMHEGASLNYSELNLRSNQLAHYLQGLGVKPEICVGICAERGFNMIVALLAVLKAGGVSVPLDPTHPTERLHSLLKDAAPAVLLTQAQLAKQFEPSLISLTLLDLDNSSLWADQPVNNLRPIGPPLLPARPAYVIYQSTSAGPNGIVVEHQGVLNLAWVHRQALNIGRDSRVLQFAPFCSDVSIWEIWMALSQGASLWIPPKNGELSGENLGQAIDHNEITHAILPLSALNGLPENAPLQTLNTVILTEENVGKAPARLRQSRHVMNAYGVTAATVCATLHACGLQEEGRSVIGRPVENTQVYILDGQQQPVPAEAIGEIYIGGAGVARGYLNAPELTANHFVPDPSSAKPGARMYKTGDRGRWRKDGAIEFMGRGRSQARVCGFRIDLGEIEAALQEHKQIRQAVIIAREESEGNVRLVAYVVPIEQAASANENSAAAFEVSELREHVRRKLPEHMVPGTYIQLDNLPLIASGKIDRNKLLQMDSEASGQKQAGPSTPAEEALVQIWQEILELERVGIHDNFFEIGGNSLTAVLVGVRVQESFNVDVPLRALFESPTVAKMARQLAGINQGQGASGTPSVVVSIQPEGSRAPFFCVHAIGGQVFGYADFSQELGLEQPFYGLQSPPPDYFPESSVSLEQIASLYNKEIRSVQPCGPYMLGGWSMGGLVAWEMAQQLIKEGETVGLLALIDTALPAPYRDADDRDEDISILGRFALEMSRLIGRDPRPLAEQFLKSAPEDQWNMVEQALTEYGLLSAKNAHADMTALLNIFTRNFQAMNSYSMNSIDLPVLFFRASETMEHLSRKWTQWAAEGIEIHSVPGDHFTILRRPNVRVIVDILQRSLSMANEQPQRAVSAEM